MFALVVRGVLNPLIRRPGSSSRIRPKSYTVFLSRGARACEEDGGNNINTKEVSLVLQTLRRLLTESHGNTCVDVKCDDGVARLFIAGRTIRLCCVRARFIVS